ncbi:MAG: hypothetical protein WAZ15_07120 [Propioniciclava sp.]|jgi:hypothetical protein
MEHRSLRLVTLIVTLAIAASSCTAPSSGTSGSSTPTGGPQVSATTDPVDATPAGRLPTDRVWPTLSGLAGGWIAVDGQQMGRDGPQSTSTLIAALGEPDEKADSATCGSSSLRNTTYRWGDFSVVVLHEVDTGDEYGETYPPGSVSGWRIDPTLDGRPGLSPNATGPAGTAIGTPLAILETRFDSEEWDYAGVEGDAGDRVFSIFVGDTTGAIFELDDNDHVAAMLAGYSCGRR